MKLIIDGLAPLAEQRAGAPGAGGAARQPDPRRCWSARVLSAGMASSAATIGLTLSLAHQGLLPLDGAIPVVLGANIGTCATALAASLRSTAEARRVAVAHIAFKVLGVALVFPFIGPLTALVAQTAARRRPGRSPTRTRFFNVAISALFLPFAPLGGPGDHRAGARARSAATIPFRTRYLDDRSLDQPSLALGQATREALRMGDVAQSMLRDAMVVLRTRQPGAARGRRAARRPARLPRARDQALPGPPRPRDHEPGPGRRRRSR